MKTMLSRKSLLQMVRRWQELASLKRRRIVNDGRELDPCPTPSVPKKGHLFIYTIDGKRFSIALRFLTSYVFRELLRLSEEEFGLPSDGPITLPCDATCMEYILTLHRHKVFRDTELAAQASVSNHHCMAPRAPKEYFSQQQQQVLYGF